MKEPTKYVFRFWDKGKSSYKMPMLIKKMTLFQANEYASKMNFAFDLRPFSYNYKKEQKENDIFV
jgi:hypothetical protein